MNQEQLQKILELHEKWLNNEEGGERANLYGANLSEANLRGADLSGAYLYRASLSGADLSGAYLYRASLSGAYLSEAYLSEANLSKANLSWADLSGANLSKAYLYRANLSGADLSGVNLYGASLYGADLYVANLYGANLSLSQVPQILIVPKEGSFIAYKKLRKGIIATLEIPADSQRINSTGRKCRAEFAKVLSLSEGTEGYSLYDETFVYKTGEIVRPSEWSSDFRKECTEGIHFFLTEEEAKEYKYY